MIITTLKEFHKQVRIKGKFIISTGVKAKV